MVDVRFDPQTGRPIHEPLLSREDEQAAPVPRFDPMTGRPVARAAPDETREAGEEEAMPSAPPPPPSAEQHHHQHHQQQQQYQQQQQPPPQPQQYAHYGAVPQQQAVALCRRHRRRAATVQCSRCGQWVCQRCIRVVRRGGLGYLECRACRSRCCSTM